MNTSYGKKKNHSSRDNKIPGPENYHLKLYKEHTDYIISTLNIVFFAKKAVMPLFTTCTLKLNLFPYLHSTISYGVTFGKIK